MAFLSKNENALVHMINAAVNLDEVAKKEMITKVKYAAKLKQDRYRKPVKVFLNVITNYKNNALVTRLSNG